MIPDQTYTPTPIFAAPPNPGADRGHHMIRKLGRNSGYCTICKATQKAGGFDKPCPGDRRTFMGGA